MTDPLALVGKTIDDKYVVEAVVGEGGFAVVYRAMHKVWRKPVAIKCFKGLAELPPDARAGLVEDFIREGAILSELSARSTAIVQARDVGTVTTGDGLWVPYMVLEWLDGETLEELRQQRPGPWTLAKAMSVLGPVAEALEHAHKAHIAHRDVKPANIFVVGVLGTDSMAVKLLDFGVAKVVQSAADQARTATTRLVSSFTPDYGAPEQFSRTRGATGPWTDVYALALILTELVTGRAAFEGDDFIELGAMSVDPKRRPTPRLFGVDLGDGVERVMARAVALEPRDRFASAGEFWSALAEAVEEASSTAPRSAAQVVTAPAPESRSTTTPASRPGRAPARRWISVGWLILLPVALIAAGIIWRNAQREASAARAPAPSVIASSAPPASASAPASACAPGMVAIPGGRFFMGSDDATADDADKPLHQVALPSYCMDREEVTVAAYKACSDHGDCKRASKEVDWPEITPVERATYSVACTARDPVGLANHPINCVDWNMATQFCAVRGARLPTEAEWEFAARGPDGRIYPWGDESPDETHLNACGVECVQWGKKVGAALASMYKSSDGFVFTAPVGSFPKGASRFGLLDVVGNVWEWTADWDAEYPKDGPLQESPKGPATGETKIIRGGAWNGSFASWVRPSKRYRFEPAAKTHAIGFRCASGGA